MVGKQVMAAAQEYLLGRVEGGACRAGSIATSGHLRSALHLVQHSKHTPFIVGVAPTPPAGTCAELA